MSSHPTSYVPHPQRTPGESAELIADSSDKTSKSAPGGARGGAQLGISATTDPGLALLINRWPTLPATLRQRILAVLREEGTTNE